MAEDTDHCVTHAHAHMNWRIKRFLDLPKDDNYCVMSPTFPLSHSKWCLLVYPNSKLSEKSAGWIGLCLKKDETNEECRVAFKIGINKDDGSELEIYKLIWTFAMRDEVGSLFLINRIRLTATKGIFAADGSLRFFCSARIVNTKKTMEKWSQTISPNVNQTLVEDLNRLYLERQNTDVTIKVKNKHLVAHKCILVTRSNVFAAMFRHNMAENRSGEVIIGDCDPNAFEAYILYLYTGKLNIVSSNNALNLFKIAEMHFVKELKEECVRCMMRELSVASFCDVMHLAIMHSESDLLTAARTFFYTYKEQILQTPKWRAFTSENPRITKNLLSVFYRKRKRQLALLQAKVKSRPNSG